MCRWSLRSPSSASVMNAALAAAKTTVSVTALRRIHLLMIRLLVRSFAERSAAAELWVEAGGAGELRPAGRVDVRAHDGENAEQRLGRHLRLRAGDDSG